MDVKQHHEVLVDRRNHPYQKPGFPCGPIAHSQVLRNAKILSISMDWHCVMGDGLFCFCERQLQPLLQLAYHLATHPFHDYMSPAGSILQVASLDAYPEETTESRFSICVLTGTCYTDAELLLGRSCELCVLKRILGIGTRPLKHVRRISNSHCKVGGALSESTGRTVCLIKPALTRTEDSEPGGKSAPLRHLSTERA